MRLGALFLGVRKLWPCSASPNLTLTYHRYGTTHMASNINFLGWVYVKALCTILLLVRTCYQISRGMTTLESC
jgi:hypothetical protein